MEYGLWTAIGLMLFAIFGVIGGIFSYYGDKACRLVLGYNLKTEEERLGYDELKLSRHYRNMFLLWSALFLMEALASFCFGEVCFGIACLLWLISFCKNIHIDEEKDFNKFKKN